MTQDELAALDRAATQGVPITGHDWLRQFANDRGLADALLALYRAGRITVIDDEAVVRATAAEAENAKLREALAEELAWHEGEAKALSKQPPRPELEWPKHQHRERIEAIIAALETDNG